MIINGLPSRFSPYGVVLYPEVNIVAISGGGLLPPEEYLSLAKGMKIAGTLKNPFKADELLEMVRSALDMD